MTRRFLLSLFFVCLGLSLFAQRLRFAVGEESPSLNAGEACTAVVSELGDGRLWLVSNASDWRRGTESLHHFQVLQLDTSLRLLRRVPLPATEGHQLVGVMSHGPAVQVLLRQLDRRSMREVLYQVDKLSGQVTSSEVASWQHSKRVESYFWQKLSPDGRSLAVVRVWAARGSDEEFAEVAIFDSCMRLCFSQPIEPLSVSDLFLTNDRRLFVAGVAVNERDRTTELSVGSFVQGSWHVSRHPLRQPLSTCKILNVHSSTLLLGGTVMSPRSKRRQLLDSGVYGLAFSLDADSVLGFHVGTFGRHDVAVLTNKPLSDPDLDPAVAGLDVASVARNGAGGLMALQLRLADRFESAESSTSIYQRLGLLVVSVDSDGSLLWCCPIRQAARRSGSDLLMDSFLWGRDGGAVLLQTEYAKTSDTYSIERPFGYFVPTQMGTLVAYLISSSGEPTKQILGRRVPFSAAACFRGSSPGLFWVLLTRGDRSLLSRLW